MSAAGRRRAPVRRALSDRSVLLLGLVVVAVVIYAVRLVQLQAVDASALAGAALENRLETRPVPAQRGDLLDRHGVVLATSVERVTVTADQQLVAEYEDPDDPRRAGPRAAAARLSPLLGVDPATLTATLTGDKNFVVVAKDVDLATWKKVDALDVTGIFYESSPARDYPAGEVGAPVLGFVGAEGAGLAGVELAAEGHLHGTDGWQQYERSGSSGMGEIPGGAALDSPPVDGDDITLTIDRDLQWRAEQALQEAMAASGAASATAVVLDVRTGEILALAAVPGFDPRDPGAVVAEQRGNSAVSDVFEPGSTSKVVTMAAVLEDGIAEPTTQYVVDDRIERGGHVFKDSHPHPRQQLTLAGILAESSNTGTVAASEAMEPQRLHDWLARFGFGARTAVELPGESPGLLPPADSWSGTQRYTVTFGQGISVTALQMAAVYQTIANGGVRIEPRVVAGRTDAHGRWIPQSTPGRHRVISADTATTMTRILESVVDDGTGTSAAVPGYRVAGKTGTAQRYDEACGGYCGYTASFAGYAPAEDPRVVVSVAVQDPVTGIYGGTTAAPVFSTIMSAALASMAVPASTSSAEPFPLTW